MFIQTEADATEKRVASNFRVEKWAKQKTSISGRRVVEGWHDKHSRERGGWTGNMGRCSVIWKKLESEQEVCLLPASFCFLAWLALQAGRWI
jgi:hypothetical protein